MYIKKKQVVLEHWLEIILDSFFQNEIPQRNAINPLCFFENSLATKRDHVLFFSKESKFTICLLFLVSFENEDNGNNK